MNETTCATGHENTIRRVAGTLVLLSAILTLWVHPGWIALAIFVGANLLQFSFTGFCPLEKILEARERRVASARTTTSRS